MGTDLSGRVSGDLVIIDGDKGLVILQPDEETLVAIATRPRKSHVGGRPSRSRLPQNPRRRPHQLLGNIRFSTRSTIASIAGGRRGLYRTEFLYLGGEASRPRGPLQAYSRVARPWGTGGHPHVRSWADKMPNMPPPGRAEPVPGAEHPRGAVCRCSARSCARCSGYDVGISNHVPVSTLLELRKQNGLADVMEDLRA